MGSPRLPEHFRLRAYLADDGYFQSFGAPGMIKINAAWFNRNEREPSRIFGFMIQLVRCLSDTSRH